jgi:hypothetical protein
MDGCPRGKMAALDWTEKLIVNNGWKPPSCIFMKKLPPSKLKHTLKSKTAIKGPLINLIVSYPRITFSGAGSKYVTASVELTPPAGWSDVTASLAGFNFTFTNGDFPCSVTSVTTGISDLPGGKIRVLAVASFYNHGNQPFTGWVDILLQYIIR